MAERRRAELEEKKAKLAEMRRAREERQAALRGDGAGAGGIDPSATPSRRHDVDNLVSQLLGSSSSNPSRSITPAPYASSSRPGTPVQRPSTPLLGGEGRGSRMSDRDEVGVRQRVDSMDYPAGSPVLDLVDSHTELFEVPRKIQTISYSRGIQTTTPTTISLSRLSSPGDGDPENAVSVGRETEDQMRKRLEREFEVERERLEREIRKEEEERKRVEEEVVKISEDEKQVILSHPCFTQFIEDSGKIIQRALSDAYDYTRDYKIGMDVGIEEDAQAIKFVCEFKDERWTKNRSVTCIDWSPKFPELCVASYNKNPKAVNDPDGIVAVWNLHLRERPEFIFHSQSDILSVTCSPFHPNLIFGGTYSGQILLWDTRARHLPVLKSPLSGSGHTYPVYAIQMVGTQNAHHLISSSTDGMVCSWLTDMLARPQETLELTHAGHAKTNEVSITSLAFPDNESGNFFVGTEEGSIHPAARYDRAGSKAGLSTKEVYRSHSGPVTSLSFHPAKGAVDFSDLFLSSGVDWTVKLWRARGKTSATNGPGTGQTSGALQSLGLAGIQEVKELFAFEEADDAVYDAKWHSVHPSTFGTVDGTGKFEVWNLNADTEVPISSTAVTPNNAALNKLAWDKHSGRHAAMGGSDGSVYVYDLGERAIPRENEWTEMGKTVAMLAGLGETKFGGLGK